MSRRAESSGLGTLRTNVVGAAFVLMLAGGLLLVLQYVSLRREAIADATAQAHVVATSSAAAVMFGDGDAAHEVLQSLGTLASIRGARIADADGGVVAAYAHDGNAPGCRLDCPLVRAPILLHGQQVGSVIVWMDMGRVHHRLLGLAGAFLVASLAAFTLSLPLMRRMRARVRAAEARLQHLAHYDPVSGQQNRNAFNACLAWTPPRPAGERHALMQLDLTVSRRSTTASATAAATSCCGRSEHGSPPSRARRTSCSGLAATSSRC